MAPACSVLVYARQGLSAQERLSVMGELWDNGIRAETPDPPLPLVGAAGDEHAVDLLEVPARVLDVLHDVVRYADVERRVAVRDPVVLQHRVARQGIVVRHVRVGVDAERLRYRYAWPSADWGSLPIEGGIEAAYTAELAEAEDPEAMLKDIEERLNRVRSPFRGAEAFLIEDIIDPRDTRPLICEFANLVAPLRKPGRVAFHVRP